MISELRHNASPSLSASGSTEHSDGSGDNQSRTSSEIQEYTKILEGHKSQFDKLWARQYEPSTPLVGFDMIRVLGTGAFGQVVLAKHKITSVHYAIKIQKQSVLVKTQQVHHTYYEKRILQSVSFPLVVNMDFSFKDSTYIYFVMPFVNGGDLFTYLKKVKKLKEDLCKFYAAQIVLALEYIHFLSLVFRDLKPENIMIDSTGYLKVCDFGFCKYVDTRTYSLCGTPDYLAPETLLMKGYGKSVDWWAFGIFLYEVSAGYPPFYDANDIIRFGKVVSLHYRFPKEFSVELKDLIRNLLQVDLSRRYGILKRGVLDIKYHKFFNGINWSDIYQQNTRAPYVPQVRNEGDTRHFESNDEINYVIDPDDDYTEQFKDF
nr:cAMP-dependent protein kinase catalytic subunit alpha-like [Onthophagus taurus]